MEPNTTYYWQIIARDDQGGETAGPVWSFTTAGVEEPAGDTIYLSPTAKITSDSVAYDDEDILTYDDVSGTWSPYFDGSDVGLKTADVNGFHLLDDGTILLTLDKPMKKLPGLETVNVDDSDIIRFWPTSLGETTAGTFELYFDGSDVDLSTGAEDLDAISLADNGDLLLSTTSNGKVDNLSFRDEDILRFAPSSLGDATDGAWELYFDSDIDSKLSDVVGVSADAESGDIHCRG
ncbi:MAG: hypothetical protein R3C44_15755 [Chloroflexota bacterium]